MHNQNNDLGVITKAKDLCSYIMVITQKSPKHFRYTFVSRMHMTGGNINELKKKLASVYRRRISDPIY